MAEVVITPRRTNISYLKELWAAKNLWRALVLRELRLRYKQTALGFLWVILQPLLGTVIFTMIFGGLFASNDPNQPPYALFVLSGLVFWNLFSDGVNFATNSFLNLGDLMKKIYFPRFLAPLASVCVAAVNFGINWGLFIILWVVFWQRQVGSGLINWGLMWLLPILIIASWWLALALGTLMATISVKWRDIKHALPFFLQMLLFLSPVIYPDRILSPTMTYISYLNPMTAIISLVHSIFFASPLPDGHLILMSAGMLIIISMGSWCFFRKRERFFADII